MFLFSLCAKRSILNLISNWTPRANMRSITSFTELNLGTIKVKTTQHHQPSCKRAHEVVRCQSVCNLITCHTYIFYRHYWSADIYRYDRFLGDQRDILLRSIHHNYIHNRNPLSNHKKAYIACLNHIISRKL